MHKLPHAPAFFRYYCLFVSVMLRHLFFPVILRLDRGISIHLSHPPSIATPARCGLTGASGGMEAEQPLIFTDLNIPVNMHRQNNAERCHNRQHNRSAVRNQRQRNADHRNKPENH